MLPTLFFPLACLATGKTGILPRCAWALPEQPIDLGAFVPTTKIIANNMQSIRKRIKEVQDQNKSYAYAHSIDRNYEVGDEVFLRVKPHKSSFKFGKVDKLSPSFFGPFKVLEKKGPVAYRLSLHVSLRRMHDVFHVSNMSHVIDLSSL
jgi:hypothetical protein